MAHGGQKRDRTCRTTSCSRSVSPPPDFQSSEQVSLGQCGTAACRGFTENASQHRCLGRAPPGGCCAQIQGGGWFCLRGLVPCAPTQVSQRGSVGEGGSPHVGCVRRRARDRGGEGRVVVVDTLWTWRDVSRREPQQGPRAGRDHPGSGQPVVWYGGGGALLQTGLLADPTWV